MERELMTTEEVEREKERKKRKELRNTKFNFTMSILGGFG